MPIPRVERVKQWKQQRQAVVKAIFAGKSVYDVAREFDTTTQNINAKLKREGVAFDKEGKPYFVHQIKAK